MISIINLGQILLSYIANTSRTCMHARAHTHTHTRARTRPHSRTRTHPPTTVAIQVVAVRWVGAPNHGEVNGPFSPAPLAMNDESVLHSNKQSCMRRGIRESFGCSSRIKTILGRTEARTRNRMCCQSIRTVGAISRDDRARIATRSLLTPTDRQTLRRIIEYIVLPIQCWAAILRYQHLSGFTQRYYIMTRTPNEIVTAQFEF